MRKQESPAVMPTTSRNRDFLIYLSIGLLCAGIFVSDWLTPLGYAVWVLYLLPTGLCLFLRRETVPLLVGAVCTVLLVAGLLLSTPGQRIDVAIFNRCVGAVTLWTLVAVAFLYIRARAQLQHSSWLQTGQMQVANAVRGVQTPEEAAGNALRALINYSGARVGVVYTLEAGRLDRLTSWALGEKGSPATLALGEGLAGQAVVENKIMIADGLPASHLSVASALGQSPASHVLAAPLTADGQVVGLLELGFTGDDREQLDDARQLLEGTREAVGMAKRAARYRSRLETLLEETQRQAEELQAQQEELRVSNEELEERSRALMDSQARLETQQVELEQTNVQLEEHAQRLEKQKQDLIVAQRELTFNTEQLERASQYKSEFLANMSHELRTPLNSSLILAKLLQDNKPGNLTPEQVRYASTIYSSNTDLLSLINDILDLAKVEAGHMEVEAEPIGVDNVIQSMTQTFEPIAGSKGLSLRAERLPGTPDSLVTDHQRLRQILKNLMSNAFKFTTEGEVVLRVAPAADGHISFAVQDSGIGIAAAQLDEIFEAFRQADGTISRKYGGSGLGLSISRELSALLGGQLTVFSEEGRGSTFTVTLPITYHGREASPASPARLAEPAASPAPAPAPNHLRAARPENAAADTARASLTPSAAALPATSGLPLAGVPDDRDHLTRERRLILAIEDDLHFAEILSDLVHELDFDFVHAPNGEQGVELAKRLQPRGILLDVGLPDDSGLTILERLKRDPITRHLPIHMVSVHDHAEAALHLGAVGYTLKPTARGELKTAIHRLEARLEQRVHRILVVEDDPSLRENIGLLLAATDLEIIGVGTIADALARLRDNTFDCVIMDLSLPDGSGYDLLKDMAERGGHSYPPVIVYTGRNLTADEERRLRYYSKSIIIKGAKSPERLLDEVTLFLHSVEADLPPDQQRMLRQARQRDTLFEGRTVLLAEDDVRNIFALSHVIEPLGANLEIARNGREALERLERNPNIDLVLMDIMMPEMDGLTAMREIRSRPAFARLPIIALTAKAMSSDRQRCLDAGANDYISKPIEVEKLLSLCRVWLSH